jgi:hypothetical protein
MIRNSAERRYRRAWEEHVLPHGPLVELVPGLWQVTGSLPRGNMPRNMVLYRLPDGQLLVHGAIALDKPTITDVESLGAPSWLVVPNGWHRLDAAVYCRRYPAMRVVCPGAARKSVAARVPVDALAEDALPRLGILCHVPDGTRPGELVYELPVAGGAALIFTDLLFNLGDLPGLDGWLFRRLGSTGFFGMTRIGRWLNLRDRPRFQAWLRQLARRTDLKAICVGHGTAITSGCAEHLEAAASRLS